MKRIDAEIYFPECQRSVTVWVADDATDAEIKEAIYNEALTYIDIEYWEK